MLVFIRATVLLSFRHVSDGEPQDGRHSTQLIQLYRDKSHHFSHMTIPKILSMKQRHRKRNLRSPDTCRLENILKGKRGEKVNIIGACREQNIFHEADNTINIWLYWIEKSCINTWHFLHFPLHCLQAEHTGCGWLCLDVYHKEGKK